MRHWSSIHHINGTSPPPACATSSLSEPSLIPHPPSLPSIHLNPTIQTDTHKAWEGGEKTISVSERERGREGFESGVSHLLVQRLVYIALLLIWLSSLALFPFLSLPYTYCRTSYLVPSLIGSHISLSLSFFTNGRARSALFIKA